MTKTQEQMTTQSKINRPSDSPLGTNRLLRLNNEMQDITTYLDNVTNSYTTVDSTINAMDGIQTRMQSVLVDLTSANNATVEDNLDTFADELQVSLDTILEFANSKFNGKYLFGGTDNSQQPYGKNGTPPPEYVQNTLDTSGEHKVKISSNISQKINITGDELFGTIDGTDLFNRLNDIIVNLRAGIQPTAAEVKEMEDFSGKILNKLSVAGNIKNRLTDSEELLNTQKLNVEELISKEKDVDMARAIVDYENQQFNLDVTYKVSSMILPKSLLDYL
jgi:flagellar hook-associated protein 3 FlgL